MKYDVDGIYRHVPPDKIPWNYETPPDAMVALIKSGKINPCKAVDLGCGTGTSALYLAGLGFDVTGIDSSQAAIALARKKAEKQGIPCRFIVADLLGDMHELDETFDFGFDWELLHTVYPEDRGTYLRNLLRLLKPGAFISR